MSTVFASQVEGWNDDDFDGGWNDDQDFTYNPLCKSALNNANMEGYSGTPTHYVDPNENPEVYFAQKKYEEHEQNGFRENIEIVKKCITDGVVLPSCSIMNHIIEKLRKIAKA